MPNPVFTPKLVSGKAQTSDSRGFFDFPSFQSDFTLISQAFVLNILLPIPGSCAINTDISP